MDAKARGLAWDEIHKRYFPFKSGNACRKRHERVLAKARDTDWDEGRIQRVLNEYNRRREQIWRTLSDGVGERWEEVEKLVSFALTSRVQVAQRLMRDYFRCSNKDFDI